MEKKITIQRLEYALEDYKTSSLSLRELAKKHKISRSTLTGFLLGRNVDVYTRKAKVNTFAFDSIDTEEKAYWLGFLYADGSIYHYKTSKRIELALQERDLEHLKKFASFLSYRGKIHYRESVKAYRIHFGCQKMHDDLVKLGCVENKFLILTFPNGEQVSDLLIRHFIRGYFDGDGCIEMQRRTDGSYRKTISLLGTHEFLSDLLSHLPFSISKIDLIKKCKNNDSNNYYFQFRKDDSAKFLDYIYSYCNIHLDRKYKHYLL